MAVDLRAIQNYTEYRQVCSLCGRYCKVSLRHKNKLWKPIYSPIVENTSKGHPDVTMKHCAYGDNVATLLNPRGVTTVSHKFSTTIATHATEVVAVPCTVHHPGNYNIRVHGPNKLHS
jgi:hypothetical protein